MDKKILLLDGLHCGSIWSLMPNRFEWLQEKQKQIQTANAIQRILFKNWQDMVKSFGPVYAVIVNGECCDGVNYKGKGQSLWTTDLYVQEACASELLQSIPFQHNKRKFFFTQGTAYHSEVNMSCDQQMSKVMSGTFGNDLLLKFNQTTFHVQHFLSSSKASLEIEIEEYMKQKDAYGKVDVFIRGHKHNYAAYEDDRGHLAIRLPSWKARDDHSKKHSLKYTPSMGYVWFVVHDDGTYDWGREIFRLDQRKLDLIEG